jgi:hypothetical protein
MFPDILIFHFSSQNILSVIKELYAQGYLFMLPKGENCLNLSPYETSVQKNSLYKRSDYTQVTFNMKFPLHPPEEELNLYLL